MTTAGAIDAPAKTALLATVNGEQLTLDDLDVELFLMKSQQSKDSVVLPEAGAVLQRLIQNTLLFQEGQRLGLDKDGMILNQVTENVRHRSVLALVDSVALSVPVDAEDRKQLQFDAIEIFIQDLRTKYDVVVDTTLIQSLDYASADPEMQAYLRNSNDVVCFSPTGAMRVSSLTKNLMFQEFHGMVGKTNADQIRDEYFRDWLAEALLTYESKQRGIPNKPEMIMLARYHTRDLMLQETIGILSKVRAEPDESEIRSFYEANIKHLTPPGRVKVKSVILKDEESAKTFRNRLVQGAEMGWLAGRTAEVLEDIAAIPTTWLAPPMIGLEPGEARVGLILDTMEVPGGWVVAIITEMEETTPVPLEECREEVMRRFLAQRTGNAITDSVKLLEDSSEIVIVPGAEDLVAEHLVEWKRKNDV